MSYPKASSGLKAILLTVDLLLAAAALAACIFCAVWAFTAASVPGADAFAEEMEALQAQAAELETQITLQAQLVARREGESQAVYQDAQAVYDAAYAEYEPLAAQRDGLQAQMEDIANIEARQLEWEQKIADLRVEYGTAVRQLEDKIIAGESKYRICYLTFDDGPSYMTPKFLDTLDKYEDVHVTFFTIGVQMDSRHYETRDAYLRRQALAGHSIANHTYTHAIGKGTGVYASVDTFMNAVRKQDEVVYNATGLHTDVVRFPAGSYYCKYRKSTINQLKEEGYTFIDWSANAYDSGNTNYSAGYTASTVIWMVRQEQISVVLMHDWRETTLGSLDKIITTLQAENYVFLPLFKESSTMEVTRPKWD